MGYAKARKKTSYPMFSTGYMAPLPFYRTIHPLDRLAPAWKFSLSCVAAAAAAGAAAAAAAAASPHHLLARSILKHTLSD